MSVLGHPKAVRTGINLKVRSLFGAPYRPKARRAWNFSADDFWSYQTESVRKVLQLATEKVPYYRERREIYSIGGGSEEDLSYLLAQIPILTKESVRRHNNELMRDPLRPLSKIHTTSGTSGTPLRIPSSLPEKAFSTIILQDWMQRVSGNGQARKLNVTAFVTPEKGRRDLFWFDRLNNAAYLSIYELNRENREQILEVVNRFSPQAIHGYPASIHELALLYPPDTAAPFQRTCVAFTTAEMLEDRHRKSIEGTLCSRVYDYYGSQEGQHLAVECQAGNLHVHPLRGIVELISKDGLPVAAGEMGRVVVTGLSSPSFPLIRYDLGDVAESTGFEVDCDCDLEWPTIGRVAGRSEDLVRTRSGGRIGHLLTRATRDVTGIDEAQLVQKGYNHLQFNLVLSTYEQVDKAGIERAIGTQMRKRLGEQLVIDFNYASSIPKGPNGKFKGVVVDMESE